MGVEHLPGSHNQEFYPVSKEDCSRLYVIVPESRRNYVLFQALEVPTSPMFPYLEKEFVDERGPSLSKISGHLSRFVCADHCIMMLMAFPNRTFSSHELAIQNLPGHDARIRAGSCGGILFSLPQHMHKLVRGIKVKNLAEGARFDLVLSLIAMQGAVELSWAVKGCLDWYKYELRTGVVQCVPVYRGHEWEFPKSNPVCLAGATKWTLENAAAELECASRHFVFVGI